ncbi:TetR/AcrR family transcriptional regulator [Streptomyces sp. NPDC047315]|uniref:TetR/AcrR family transcriptional regulator n=1 Tax=Streptomyces sp. NPDC047315 TaxID=3155142 RepID=UPI0033F54947
MTTETSGSGDIARSLELLWGTAERPSRGPKPGLALDTIVAAAIAVADSDGIAAVSMRRIASELGTGTMSLYRYVPGKAELLDLMLDRVSAPETGEPSSDGAVTDWRAAVESVARGYRDLYLKHPWLLRVNQARTVLGPSALRSLEAALTGLQGLQLRDAEKISVIISVQSLVTGIVRMDADANDAVEETGLGHDEFWTAQRPFLERAMKSGDYPMMATMDDDTFSEEFDHFEFGLALLLDGLDATVARRTEGPPSAA